MLSSNARSPLSVGHECTASCTSRSVPSAAVCVQHLADLPVSYGLLGACDLHAPCEGQGAAWPPRMLPCLSHCFGHLRFPISILSAPCHFFLADLKHRCRWRWTFILPKDSLPALVEGEDGVRSWGKFCLSDPCLSCQCGGPFLWRIHPGGIWLHLVLHHCCWCMRAERPQGHAGGCAGVVFLSRPGRGLADSLPEMLAFHPNTWFFQSYWFSVLLFWLFSE